METQDAGLGALSDLEQKTLDIIDKLEALNGIGGGPTVEEKVYNINCKCCCDCEPPVEPPGTPVDPLCAEEGILEADQFYKFWQGYPSKGTCDYKYYLFSTSINFDEDDLEGKYHGRFEDPLETDEFAQGAGAVKEETEELKKIFTTWIYDKNQSALLEGIGGGQLRDSEGNCLGYTGIDNYDIDDTRV